MLEKKKDQKKNQYYKLPTKETKEKKKKLKPM